MAKLWPCVTGKLYLPTVVRLAWAIVLATRRCSAVAPAASRASNVESLSKLKCEMPRRASSRALSAKRRTQLAFARAEVFSFCIRSDVFTYGGSAPTRGVFSSMKCPRKIP